MTLLTVVVMLRRHPRQRGDQPPSGRDEREEPFGSACLWSVNFDAPNSSPDPAGYRLPPPPQ